MKPIFLRTAKDKTTKTDYNWHKCIYIFGIKVAEWKYDSKKEGDSTVGFGNPQ